MPQHPNTPTRRRSKAWIYYGLIAVLGLVASNDQNLWMALGGVT